MNTLQNPSPNQSTRPHPNPNSNPVPYPNVAPSSSSSLTFDEVSKLFSLPLSDAADSLGVSPSVLKKICYENGLVRWPYRKILAGKSLEEIKEDEAREKSKHLNQLPEAAGQVNDDLAGSTVTSVLASPLHNKTSSVQELPKPQIVMQQGNKSFQTGSPVKCHGSTLTKVTPSNLDEFKYGFPSDGLSSICYRWWGDGNSTGSVSTEGNGREEIQDKKKFQTNLVDSDVLPSMKDGDKCKKKTDKSDSDSSGIGSLTALRKKAVKEGQEALKLGIHRRHGINKLDRMEKLVLVQIFKSSLPSEWRDLSF